MFTSKYFAPNYFTSSYWSDDGTASAAVNTMMYNGNPVVDIKYFDGSFLMDVILEMNGSIVWKT